MLHRDKLVAALTFTFVVLLSLLVELIGCTRQAAAPVIAAGEKALVDATCTEIQAAQPGLDPALVELECQAAGVAVNAGVNQLVHVIMPKELWRTLKNGNGKACPDAGTTTSGADAGDAGPPCVPQPPTPLPPPRSFDGGKILGK